MGENKVSTRIKGKLALDAHAHLRSGKAFQQNLNYAMTNFRVALPSDAVQPVAYCLFLTQSEDEQVFEQICDGRLTFSNWQIESTSEPVSCVLTRDQEKPVILIAGQQVTTKERLEVLIIGQKTVPAQGFSFQETIDNALEENMIVILPWGFGKWTGIRYRRLEGVLKTIESPNLFLGDNRGRPGTWLKPALFQRMSHKGFFDLPGSDPLPVPVDERTIGSYGCLIEGEFNLDTPWQDIKNYLCSLEQQPRRFGNQTGTIESWRKQWTLRRSQ